MQHSFVMPSEEHLSKVGGIGAIVGVVVLFVATMVHPQNAHPGDAPAAFAEYANATRFFPVIMPSTNSRFCSSLPKRMMVGPTVLSVRNGSGKPARCNRCIITQQSS